jgi:hypothetical protein
MFTELQSKDLEVLVQKGSRREVWGESRDVLWIKNPRSFEKIHLGRITTVL